MRDAESERVYIEKAIDNYAESMMRAAYNIVGSKTEAEDVVQEAFIKLHRKRPKFESSEHEKAWLLRVTINEAKNSLKKLRRSICADDISAEQSTVDQTGEIDVLEAVRSLDEKYRVIIHLHYYEGYTVSQAAQILGIPASTAGTRLERAKAQLKDLLKGE